MFEFNRIKYSTSVIYFLVVLILQCAIGCAPSFTDEEAKKLSQKTMDQFFTALIDKDEVAFEACFIDRTTYLVNGEHIFSIRKDYERFNDYEEKMTKLRDSFKQSQDLYDKMSVYGGREVEFYSPIDASKGRRIVLKPSGEQWKIADIDFEYEK